MKREGSGGRKHEKVVFRAFLLTCVGKLLYTVVVSIFCERHIYEKTDIKQ